MKNNNYKHDLVSGYTKMKFIEPHIHMSSRTTDDYQALKDAGCICVIEPAFWSGTDKTCPGSFYDYFRHLLNFEHERARKYEIYHYSFIGINPKEAKNTDIAFKVIKSLKEFLKHRNCLGVGEIGLDLIVPEEEEVLRQQIRIAEELKLPVIIHSPHTNKRVGIEKTIKILKEENVNLKKYLIDHNTEETIGMVLEIPEIFAGITLYPTKMTIERTTGIIKRYGAERILINSSADWGKSYPLNVSNAISYFRKSNIDENTIKKIVYENPVKFFSQSPNFKLD